MAKSNLKEVPAGETYDPTTHEVHPIPANGQFLATLPVTVTFKQPVGMDPFTVDIRKTDYDNREGAITQGWKTVTSNGAAIGADQFLKANGRAVTDQDKIAATLINQEAVTANEYNFGGGGGSVTPTEVVARGTIAGFLVAHCNLKKVDADKAARDNLAVAFSTAYEAKVATAGEKTTPEETLAKYDAHMKWAKTEATRRADADKANAM